MHAEAHPLAGKTAKIKPEVKHFQFPNFGGSECRVNDWWDRLGEGSWMFCNGNPACLVYALRCAKANLPTDDEVLYVKVGGFGHLVHVSEIEGASDNGASAFARPKVALTRSLGQRRDLPHTCLLPRPMVEGLFAMGQHPCDGCNHDRSECHGFPRK